MNDLISTILFLVGFSLVFNVFINLDWSAKLNSDFIRVAGANLNSVDIRRGLWGQFLLIFSLIIGDPSLL